MLNYCALIPARDEAERIAATLQAVASRREIARIVVIDDASRDETAAIARASGAHDTIRLERNAGKGGALNAGLEQVGAEFDGLLFLDADLGDSATECVKLMLPLERGEADMAVGLLPPDPALAAAGESGGGLGLVVGAARRGLLKRTGKEFQQPLAGQRALRREVLAALPGGRLPSGFGVEVGLTLAALRAGCRVVEVPTAFRHRVSGGDLRASLHRARQLIDVAAVLRG